jgi:hypothetical protein
MRRVLLASLSLLFLLALQPALARAGDKATDAPAVVVRVKSLNALLQNLNLVVRLVGQEEAALQIEGLIKSKIGKKGIEGIDPSRPFGAYVRFGKAIDEINGAILIPMVDQDAFLTLLDNVGVNYAKGKDDIYTHKTNKNVDLYFRFANKYLYITSLNTESIQAKNLVDPAKALAIPSDAAISLVAHVDRIPNDVKLIALAQLDETIQAAQKNGPPNETKAQEQFRVALLGDAGKIGSSLIREAAEVRFDLDIAEKTKEMTVDLKISGKPGSEFAKSLDAIGKLKSPLAGLVKKDLAFEGAVHFALPNELQKAFNHVIDDVIKQSLAGIQNADKKKQAEALFKAMTPTAKAGEYQVVANVVGPQNDRFTFIGAIKLKEGAKLGQTVHDLIKQALTDIPEAERGKIQLDFDSVGAIKIHRFEAPKNPQIDPIVNDIAGDKYLYLAFREDALFLAMGKEALPLLKSALAKTDSVASPPLVFDFDLARMAKLMAKTPEHKELAAKLFPAGENGRVRFTVEGGARLNARLQMRLNVFEFLVKLKKQD